MKIPKETMKEILAESAEFSIFCQEFKMRWWKNDDYMSRNLPESWLDELSIIAWDILNK